MFNYFLRTERLWKDPVVRKGWECLGWGTKLQCCCGQFGLGNIGLLLFFLLPVSLTERTRNRWAASQTAAWQQHGQERNSSSIDSGGERGREPFCGHHCGNIVNCAFLRPWESHTRTKTCGHGLILLRLYVRCRTALFDHSVICQWRTFSAAHQGGSLTETEILNITALRTRICWVQHSSTALHTLTKKEVAIWMIKTSNFCV